MVICLRGNHEQWLIEFPGGDDNLALWGVKGGRSTLHSCGVGPLNDQADRDLIWIGDKFLNHPAPFGKVVVHGHSCCAEVKSHANRIHIDTAVYIRGRLICVILKGGARHLLQATGAADAHPLPRAPGLGIAVHHQDLCHCHPAGRGRPRGAVL